MSAPDVAVACAFLAKEYTDTQGRQWAPNLTDTFWIHRNEDGEYPDLARTPKAMERYIREENP